MTPRYMKLGTCARCNRRRPIYNIKRKLCTSCRVLIRYDEHPETYLTFFNILTGFEEALKNTKNLRVLSEEYLKRLEDKKGLITQIGNYQAIILKNLHKEKKIVIDANKVKYYVSPIGISTMNLFSVNATNITYGDNLLKDLIFISANLRELKKVLTTTKYDLICDYLKEIHLLKETENCILYNKKEIYYEHPKEKPAILNKIILKQNKFHLDYLYNPYWVTGYIGLNWFEGLNSMNRIDNLLIIEQVQSELEPMMMQALQNIQVETENLKKFINHTKNRFGTQLALEELSKEPQHNTTA